MQLAYGVRDGDWPEVLQFQRVGVFVNKSSLLAKNHTNRRPLAIHRLGENLDGNENLDDYVNMRSWNDGSLSCTKTYARFRITGSRLLGLLFLCNQLQIELPCEPKNPLKPSWSGTKHDIHSGHTTQHRSGSSASFALPSATEELWIGYRLDQFPLHSLVLGPGWLISSR